MTTRDGSKVISQSDCAPVFARQRYPIELATRRRQIGSLRAIEIGLKLPDTRFDESKMNQPSGIVGGIASHDFSSHVTELNIYPGRVRDSPGSRHKISHEIRLAGQDYLWNGPCSFLPCQCLERELPSTYVEGGHRSIVKFVPGCRGHLQISQSSSNPSTIYPNQPASRRKYFNPSINPAR